MTDRQQQVTDRDVYITRAFDAPRELVWRFFTEPELLARWFGPHLWRVPVESVRIDPRAGGEWSLSMVGEDGTRAPLGGLITAFDPPEYLEIELSAQSTEGDLDRLVLRIRLDDHGAKTRMTLHQGPFDDDGVRDLTTEGWGESFVELDAALQNA